MEGDSPPQQLSLKSASPWQLMHWDTFKQDDYSTEGGYGGCRVGEVRAGTTSPMPDHTGFKATVTVRDPPTPILSELSEI